VTITLPEAEILCRDARLNCVTPPAIPGNFELWIGACNLFQKAVVHWGFGVYTFSITTLLKRITLVKIYCQVRASTGNISNLSSEHAAADMTKN
jgi:hypothetical protein